MLQVRVRLPVFVVLIILAFHNTKFAMQWMIVVVEKMNSVVVSIAKRKLTSKIYKFTLN